MHLMSNLCRALTVILAALLTACTISVTTSDNPPAGEIDGERAQVTQIIDALQYKGSHFVNVSEVTGIPSTVRAEGEL